MKYLLVTLYWVSFQNSASPVSAVHEHYSSQAACERAAKAVATLDRERLTGGGYKLRVNAFCVAVDGETAD